MEKLFQALYSGILYGSIYGLMAIGLTLIWGSLRRLNMAHGALYVVGGYLAWTALKLWGLPPLLALALGVLAGALIGLRSTRLRYPRIPARIPRRPRRPTEGPSWPLPSGTGSPTCTPSRTPRWCSARVMAPG